MRHRNLASSGLRLGLAAIAALAWSGAAARAQTEWSVEGGLATAGEYNAPPPPCVPAPPPYAILPPPAPPPGCPTIAPFSPMVGLGGSGFDNNGNVLSGGPATPAVISTDGFTIVMSTVAGAYLASWFVPPGMILPGPISGLDYDSAADIIWITDGLFAAGLGILPVCGVPAIAVPPFPVPSCTGAPAWGIAWSPCTGTLWTCDAAGGVNNFLVGGGFLGCFGTVGVLPPPLTGATINTTNGNVQVTNGIMVAEFTPAGVLAPAGPFYLTANPYPVPLWAAPLSGLGFSLRPESYGIGSSPIGLPPSVASAGGYPFAGNGGFMVGETGAAPGAAAVIIYGLFRACPALPVAGCPPGTGLWVAPAFKILGVGLVPGSGTKMVPAPIPAPGAMCGLPVGAPLYVQFANFGGPIPPGFVQLSDALAFTIGSL